MSFKVKINTKEISTNKEFKPSQYIFIGPRELKISKIDVKLTNKCDLGCNFCHEKSNINGKHADLTQLIKSFSISVKEYE